MYETLPVTFCHRWFMLFANFFDTIAAIYFCICIHGDNNLLAVEMALKYLFLDLILLKDKIKLSYFCRASLLEIEHLSVSFIYVVKYLAWCLILVIFQRYPSWHCLLEVYYVDCLS